MIYYFWDGFVWRYFGSPYDKWGHNYVNPYSNPYYSPNLLKDHGNKPYVVNIEEATMLNPNFRTALWTGPHLQLTLMDIPVGEEIGAEVHPDTDQFLRIEQGQGVARFGTSQSNWVHQEPISAGSAILVPAGTWHNIINTGNVPLKLYSIYAPPHHPFGTIHVTKAAAMD